MTEAREPATDQAPIDLDAYLARIGYHGQRSATLETLDGLHLAHATSIPFENLDILLGLGISLELDRLQAKLVAGRRGGYCFEHNTVFAAVLEMLGFHVTRLAARVRLGTDLIRPRSHMLLSVDVEGEPWLSDVGFGGGGPLHPIRMRSSQDCETPASRFRVERDGELNVLQSLRAGGWLDLYTFTLEPQYQVDYEVANHYTSTHPHSPFVRTLVVQRQNVRGRLSLVNRELTEEEGGRETARTLEDDAALLEVLADRFDLHFPRGTRFGYVSDEHDGRS